MFYDIRYLAIGLHQKAVLELFNIILPCYATAFMQRIVCHKQALKVKNKGDFQTLYIQESAADDN